MAEANESPLDAAIREVREELGLEYVDRHFVQAAAGLSKVRFVNLRDDRFPECAY